MSIPKLDVLLPGRNRTRRYTGSWLRDEIARHSPATLLLKCNNHCVEVTPDLFFSLLRQDGVSFYSLPWEVTVPRRGWIVLVPRSAIIRRRFRRGA